MTLRLMSKAGRISSPGQVMGVIRTMVSDNAMAAIGKIRMLRDPETRLEGGHLHNADRVAARCHSRHACSFMLCIAGWKPSVWRQFC